MIVWQQFHSNTVLMCIHLKLRDQEAGKQARTWCRNMFGSFLIYDSLEKFGFWEQGTKVVRFFRNAKLVRHGET